MQFIQVLSNEEQRCWLRVSTYLSICVMGSAWRIVPPIAIKCKMSRTYTVHIGKRCKDVQSIDCPIRFSGDTKEVLQGEAPGRTSLVIPCMRRSRRISPNLAIINLVHYEIKASLYKVPAFLAALPSYLSLFPLFVWTTLITSQIFTWHGTS